MRYLKSTGPEQPKWFSEPILIGLPYEKVEPGFAGEFVVSIKFEGVSTSTLVPERAVNESSGTVDAWAIGVTGSDFLVDLLPSTMGSNRLKIRQSAIQHLVK